MISPSCTVPTNTRNSKLEDDLQLLTKWTASIKLSINHQKANAMLIKSNILLDANYKRKTVGYPSSMRYNDSVGDCPAEICELFESVYNVETCDSETEVNGNNGNKCFDSSNGCGFSGIWLRISHLETPISGLDANKGPRNDGVLLLLLNSTRIG
jgi:hypothetical protein